MPPTVKQFRHSVDVTCGGSECEVEFSLYHYKDEPHVQRPKMYNPPTLAARPEQLPTQQPATGESKVKNVTVKQVNIEGAK